MDEFKLKPHEWLASLHGHVEQEIRKERAAARRAMLAGLRIKYKTENLCGEIPL